MRYEDLLARLYAQNQFAIKYDLAAMTFAVQALGLERVCPRIVLIGGTNGKGSTAAALASMAHQYGWRAGLYTSPHLIDFRERIRVDGRPVVPELCVAAGEAILDRFSGQNRPAEGPRPLTYFELTTLMALDIFRNAAPALDLVILEVGMGGRLDAVNAVARDLVLLTGVAMDHSEYLGDSLEAIAREKAGLCSPAVPVILCRTAGGADLLVAACSANGAAANVIDCGDGSTPMEQARALAGDAMRRLVGGADASGVERAILDGGARARWPGRQDSRTWRGRTVLVDGAHNRQSAEACAAWLDRLSGGRRGHLQVVTGLSGQRSTREVIEPLLPFAARFLVTAPASRPAPAVRVAQDLRALGAGEVEVQDDAGSALDAALRVEDDVLVVGSLYLVGDALAAMGLVPEDLTLW